MENKERATEQLSGRVTESQKEYFSNIEGTFTEKVAELIELHKNKKENDTFTISGNLDAINKAINTIVKNVEVIEYNTNTYIDDFNDTLSLKIAELENDSIELKNTIEENNGLKIANKALLEQYNNIELRCNELEKTLENNENTMNTLVEKNNSLLQEKLGYKERLEHINSSYRSKIEVLEQNIKEQSKSINDLNNSISVKNEKINFKDEKIQELKTEVQELKLDLKESKKSNEELTKNLNDRISTLLDQLETNRIDKQKIELDLSNKIDKLTQELHKEQLEKQKLQLELNNIQDMQ